MMPKRFTETNLWEEDWFIAMPKDYQFFWIFIKDACDHAGIWRPNVVKFNKLFDFKLDLPGFLKAVNLDKERVTVLKNGRLFINGFIPFQYGNSLNLANRVHNSVYELLIENEVNLTSIRPQIEVIQGLKDKDKDKDIIHQKDIIEPVQVVFSHFCLVLRKKILLSPERRKLIEKRLQEGRTVKEMTVAIDNFSKDDWPDRHKYCDLVYVIGVRNKVDNLDRWLAKAPKGGVLTFAERDSWRRSANVQCTNCRGTGEVYAPGSGNIIRCGCWNIKNNGRVYEN